MNLKDFFCRVISFLGEGNHDKREYQVKNPDCPLRYIPISAYLVIKKYGWVVFFHKSINYIELLFQMCPQKTKRLYRQTIFSLNQEGLGKMMLRVLNYIFYGKGVLDRREIRRRRNKFKPETYNTKHISALNINTIKEIEFTREENPKVSIVIPIFNKWKYTYNCLDTLKEKIADITYEIVLVDDGSSDETEEMVKKIKNIAFIKNEKNIGFVGSCNVGAKKASGKFIVFLNNDTAVKKNWLEALLKTFQDNENVGLVGSKLIYPDGRLQEAGGIVWKNKNVWNYGRYKNPNDSEFNYLKDVDYCSGASIMLPRNVFEKLGGFDSIFSPGYFEDTDLAFRVKQLGMRTVFQPKSELFHFEGITSGNDLDSGMKKYQEINKEKFFSRWKDVLEKENLSDDIKNGQFFARDRSNGKKIILFMDHNVPTFDKDAGSFIAFQYLKILNDFGHKIIFWPHNLVKLDPYVDTLQQMGIEVVFGDKCFKDFIRENGKFINIAFISRPHVAEEYMDLAKQNSNAKILYIPHDLHFLREMREAEIENNEEMKNNAVKTKKIEEFAMRTADNSLFFSKEEVGVVKNEFFGISAGVAPWIQEIENSSPADFKNRKGLVFLGGYAHKPNIDAVIWFHNEIFPRIAVDDIEVIFYGSNPPKEILDLASDNFKIVGFIEEGDVKKVLDSARIFIAPLRFGAGFKGKIAKAMSNGLPVITTDIGAEGIGLVDGINALIANDAESFISNIERLYKNEDLWKELSKNSIEHVRNNFSVQNAKNLLKKILEEI